MKRVVISIFLSLALLVPGLVLSQPANGPSECKDLNFSKGKLQGLCVAICHAQECNPDMDGDSSGDDGSSSNDSSDDDCDPPSQKLIDKFNEARDPLVDPGLPCLMEDAMCPCFTQAEADAMPLNPSCYAQCNADELDGGGNLLTNIIGTFTPVNVVQVNDEGDGGSCLYFLNGGSFRFLPLTAEEVAGCREVIQNTQQAFNGCPPPIGSCLN